MKRRKKGELGSLDSLLDTMTSVVGILIIILVVLQLGAKQAVDRIQSDPNASPSIKQAIEKLEKLEQARDQLKEDRLRLTTERDQLFTNIGGAPSGERKKNMEKELASLQPKSSNPQLAKQVSSLRKQNAQFTTDSKSTETKVNELKKKLAAAPKKPARPANKNLRLPDPKEPRPGSRGYRLICTGGKVYPIDYSAWSKRVQDALNKSGVAKNGQNERDGKALVDHFKKKPLGDSLFYAQTFHDEKRKALYFRLIPKKGTGDLPQNLGKPQSSFQKFLAKLDKKKSHILFTVFPDSFDAYMAARKILGEKGLPAGWDPSGAQAFAYQSHFNTYTNGHSKLPKPKPSPPKSAVQKAILD